MGFPPLCATHRALRTDVAAELTEASISAEAAQAETQRLRVRSRPLRFQRIFCHGSLGCFRGLGFVSFLGIDG